METLFHIIIQERKFFNDKLFTLSASSTKAALKKIEKLEENTRSRKFIHHNVQVIADEDYNKDDFQAWVIFYPDQLREHHCRILAKDTTQAEKEFSTRFPGKMILRVEAERKKEAKTPSRPPITCHGLRACAVA